MSRRWAFAIAGVSVALIFWATLMPVGQKNDLLSVFPVDLHADKVGHFLGFAAFGAALYWTGRVTPTRIMLAAFLLAAVTEGLQIFVAGRVPLATDVLIDTAGALLGLVIARRWWRPMPARQNAQ